MWDVRAGVVGTLQRVLALGLSIGHIAAGSAIAVLVAFLVGWWFRRLQRLRNAGAPFDPVRRGRSPGHTRFRPHGRGGGAQAAAGDGDLRVGRSHAAGNPGRTQIRPTRGRPEGHRGAGHTQGAMGFGWGRSTPRRSSRPGRVASMRWSTSLGERTTRSAARSARRGFPASRRASSCSAGPAMRATTRASGRPQGSPCDADRRLGAVRRGRARPVPLGFGAIRTTRRRPRAIRVSPRRAIASRATSGSRNSRLSRTRPGSRSA